MKLIFTLTMTFFNVLFAFAATYTFQTDGDWTEESNWDIYPGTTTSSSDSLIIDADLIVNASVTVDGYLQVNADRIFTNDWLVTVNGDLINNGNFQNDSQLNLFGDGVNNGIWTNLESGTLIVTNTASFTTYGNFINDGSILGYNNSLLFIEGEFINNDHMTINSTIDIKLNPDDIFTNNGFSQYNGNIRLEGEMVNGSSGNFKINPSAIFILPDNSKLTNTGIINIDGVWLLSSQTEVGSSIGHVNVSGNLQVKKSIPKIL